MEQLPRLLLGTSSLIASGQFSERFLEYYAKFVGRPEAVEGVARASLEVGVRGVLLPIRRSGFAPAVPVGVRGSEEGY